MNQDHDLYLLINTQNSIGWFNFMEGKMSRYIQYFQEKYLRYIDSKRSSGKWMMLFIDNIVKFIHNQWNLRNTIVHEITQDGLKSEEKEALRQQIKEELLLYNENNVLSDDQHLYKHTFEEIWMWSGYQKIHWLQAIQTARKIYRNKQKRKSETILTAEKNKRMKTTLKRIKRKGQVIITKRKRRKTRL